MRCASRRALAAPLIVAGLGLALPAAAQTLPLGDTEWVIGGTGAGSFPAERLRPATDREGILDVESGRVGHHLEWDVALWMGYALNPLVLYENKEDGTIERAGSLVGHRVGANLVADVALFEWLELGVDLPLVLFQYGDKIPGVEATNQPLFFAGIGDLRLAPKLRLLRAREQFVDLALMFGVTLPTGFPAEAYMGEGFMTLVPELMLSRELFGVKLAGNLGYRVRPVAKLADLDIGHEVTYRAGVGYRFDHSFNLPLEVDVSVNGATTLIPFLSSIRENPAEFMMGGSYDIWGPFQGFVGGGFALIAGYGAPDVRVFGGLRASYRHTDRDGDDVPDKDDNCPEVAEDVDGFEDADGCPDEDNDNDGVLDVDDPCPDDAEDTDQFEDDDGCPEADNDQDGVLDGDDQCPIEAEDHDGFEEQDGCPDPDNDQDGILDVNDKCPNDPGLEAFEGCPDPDADDDGILDVNDKCVNDPEDLDGFSDDDGCPDPDNDADGLPDNDDACPEEPEDEDGFEDEDGCPDLDNDKDGISDLDDECPEEPEVINGVDDEDGCPDVGKTKVIITKERVEILEKVYFDFGKATIQTRSHNLLGQVGSILRANPEVTKLRIEGHTDDKGSESFNRDLSQARAEAVRDFLVGRGIDAGRLEAKGYGEARPIATNGTEAGREKNRRVEFTIVEVGGVATPEADAAPDAP